MLAASSTGCVSSMRWSAVVKRECEAISQPPSRLPHRRHRRCARCWCLPIGALLVGTVLVHAAFQSPRGAVGDLGGVRSEEHTSELQSRFELVCRLLIEKKKAAL